MKVGTSFLAFTAVTLSLCSVAVAESNQTESTTLAAEIAKSFGKVLQQGATPGLGVTSYLIGRAANITARHPRKVGGGLALGAMIGVTALKVGKPMLERRRLERRYLDRYEAMKRREYETPGDLSSRSFLRTFSGGREYYNHIDEASRLIEEAYLDALRSVPASKRGPLVAERRSVRLVVQKAQLRGRIHIMTVIALLSDSDTLRPMLVKLGLLLAANHRAYGTSAFSSRDHDEPQQTRDAASKERHDVLKATITAELTGDENAKQLKTKKRQFLLRYHGDRAKLRGDADEIEGIDMDEALQIFDDLINEQAAKEAK